MNYWIPIAISLIIIPIILLIWFWFRMNISKAKFALLAITTLFTCLTAFLGLISANVPQILAMALANALGVTSPPTNSFLPNILAFILTGVISFLIYKFSKYAILNWEAPPRVSERELAKDLQNNNMILLALSQFSLFLNRRPDPLAEEHDIAWNKQFSEPPNALENRILLKDLFTSYIREVDIPDNGWRDRYGLWIGEIFTGSNDKSIPLYLLIFDELPTKKQIESRLDVVKQLVGENTECAVYGLYPTEEYSCVQIPPIKYAGLEISLHSSIKMIVETLDLKNYAREIRKEFLNTQIGGTNVTLLDSYVELTVTENDSLPSQPLSNLLEEWEAESSRRHLVITGEYGQGKSTAMLKYCYEWANTFLETSEINSRIPLLIVLRGKSPAESEPLSFIAQWSARYGLLPQAVFNLIKSGQAIIIFEGFDELRNAGRAYDRHQHFNALWRYSFPNTKIIFTGRPNFFLDDNEANNTLRKSGTMGAAGEAYTTKLEIEKLKPSQIQEACRNFPENVKTGISNSINEHAEFLDIVSRPSMLPVVATIWYEIERLQKSGIDLTGALLVENYLQAIYRRKEAELERDRVQYGSPDDARYLVLPKAVRELLTICVAWRMAGKGFKNTIPRSDITAMVGDLYADLFIIGQSKNISSEIREGLGRFEQKYAEETQADRVEIITSELCSAGLLVPDPAGGNSNLRFPHKQFYEFLISKAFCCCILLSPSAFKQLFQKSSNETLLHSPLLREPNAINYLVEIIGTNIWMLCDVAEYRKSSIIAAIRNKIILFFNSSDQNKKYRKIKYRDHTSMHKIFGLNRMIIIMTCLMLILLAATVAYISKSSSLNALSYYSIYFVCMSQIILIILFIANISYSHFLNTFIEHHWLKHKCYSLRSFEYHYLVAKSLAVGIVQFPNNTPKKRISLTLPVIQDYLSPSQDFGEQLDPSLIRKIEGK